MSSTARWVIAVVTIGLAGRAWAGQATPEPPRAEGPCRGLVHTGEDGLLLPDPIGPDRPPQPRITAPLTVPSPSSISLLALAGLIAGRRGSR